MGIMQVVAVTKAVIQLLPILVDLIKAVEAALPGTGRGEQKLMMVRAALEGAYSTISDATVTFEKVWSALNPLIGAVVAGFNKTGTFKK